MQLYQHQSHFKKCSKTPFPLTAYKLPNWAQRVRNPTICPYMLLLSIPYTIYISPSHLYVLPTPIICPYPRSTHSSTSNYNMFVSISRLRAFEDFVFDFVIASARFKSPLIHLTSTISLHSYTCQRHIMSIISRFSCVIPNLTKHLYSDLESIQRTSSKSISSTLSIIDFTKAPMSKP